MARAKARTDRLSTVLSRKKPEEIETAVADLLENGRRQALGRMAAATTRELEILQRTLEEAGEDQARTARLAHLVAVAQGDRDLAETAAVAITRIRKPTPNSLTLAGHVAIRGGKLPTRTLRSSLPTNPERKSTVRRSSNSQRTVKLPPF
jgi:hypothetical protein